MKLDATVVGKALDLAYDKAVDGVPGVPSLGSAEGLAEDYLNDPGLSEEKVDALIVTKGEPFLGRRCFQPVEYLLLDLVPDLAGLLQPLLLGDAFSPRIVEGPDEPDALFA